ncbi:hypothetical protein DIR46_13930 [Massilia oculi]|uniref:Uncharacterized protein n=1 Tax=Massilia oculi TaxID=945844 RepID=A0A2S2DJ71_9BURK|nr:hypothetical protein DIR46_13930 [Massilia oculi]
MISFVLGGRGCSTATFTLHYTYADRKSPGKSDEMQIFRHELQKATPNGAANRVAAEPRLG